MKESLSSFSERGPRHTTHVGESEADLFLARSHVVGLHVLSQVASVRSSMYCPVPCVRCTLPCIFGFFVCSDSQHGGNREITAEGPCRDESVQTRALFSLGESRWPSYADKSAESARVVHCRLQFSQNVEIREITSNVFRS